MNGQVVIDEQALAEMLRPIVRAEVERIVAGEVRPGRLLTPAEAADVLGVSERSVARQCLNGELPAVRVGRYWRIRREDLPGS